MGIVATKIALYIKTISKTTEAEEFLVNNIIPETTRAISIMQKKLLL